MVPQPMRRVWSAWVVAPRLRRMSRLTCVVIASLITASVADAFMAKSVALASVVLDASCKYRLSVVKFTAGKTELMPIFVGPRSRRVKQAGTLGTSSKSTGALRRRPAHSPLRLRRPLPTSRSRCVRRGSLARTHDAPGSARLFASLLWRRNLGPADPLSLAPCESSLLWLLALRGFGAEQRMAARLDTATSARSWATAPSHFGRRSGSDGCSISPGSWAP